MFNFINIKIIHMRIRFRKNTINRNITGKLSLNNFVGNFHNIKFVQIAIKYKRIIVREEVINRIMLLR